MNAVRLTGSTFNWEFMKRKSEALSKRTEVPCEFLIHFSYSHSLVQGIVFMYDSESCVYHTGHWMSKKELTCSATWDFLDGFVTVVESSSWGFFCK